MYYDKVEISLLRAEVEAIRNFYEKVSYSQMINFKYLNSILAAFAWPEAHGSKHGQFVNQRWKLER